MESGADASVMTTGFACEKEALDDLYYPRLAPKEAEKETSLKLLLIWIIIASGGFVSRLNMQGNIPTVFPL